MKKFYGLLVVVMAAWAAPTVAQDVLYTHDKICTTLISDLHADHQTLTVYVTVDEDDTMVALDNPYLPNVADQITASSVTFHANGWADLVLVCNYRIEGGQPVLVSYPLVERIDLMLTLGEDAAKTSIADLY